MAHPRLEFKSATSQDDRVARLKLLTEVYLRSRFIRPEDCRSDLFIDEYEGDSVPLVAKHNGMVIGSARLLVNTHGEFPIEKLKLERSIPSSQPSIEITQLAVARKPDIPGHWTNHAVMLGLIYLIVRWSRSHDTELWYAVLDAALLRLFAICGFAFRPIGTLQKVALAPYLASGVLPVSMNLSEGMAALQLTNKPLHDFFDSCTGTGPGEPFEWFFADGDTEELRP